MLQFTEAFERLGHSVEAQRQHWSRGVYREVMKLTFEALFLSLPPKKASKRTKARGR